MDRLDSTLFFVSAILQLAAILFAIRMSREVQDRGPWLVMLAALALMFAARILAMFIPRYVLHINPWFAISTSLLLLIALFAIRRVANAERLSRLSAVANAAERDASEGRY